MPTITITIMAATIMAIPWLFIITIIITTITGPVIRRGLLIVTGRTENMEVAVIQQRNNLRAAATDRRTAARVLHVPQLVPLTDQMLVERVHHVRRRARPTAQMRVERALHVPQPAHPIGLQMACLTEVQVACPIVKVVHPLLLVL